MTDQRDGSYKLGDLEGPEKELDRLRKQGENFKHLEVGILRKVGLQAHHKVLELGCGPGFVSKIIAEVACDGAMVCVDVDQQLLDILPKEVTKPPKGGLKVYRCSADAVPVEDGWADFTYARFLLQHVPDPLAIVREAYRATAPGGRFCAVDSDDGLILHFPEDARIGQFLRDAEAAQAEHGGDRFVGRKQMSLMQQAGFSKVNATIVSLTSTEIPFHALAGILFGYKSSLLGRREETQAMLTELAQAAGAGKFLLCGGVFVVTGEK